jgi:hypothetical protein
MEQLPKIVRERLQTGAKAKVEVHPDANLLTAFAENSLVERERLPVLEHLSACADCREVVTLAQPELVMGQVAAAAAMAASPAPSRPRWSSRLIFSWGAVAACVVVGAVLLHYQTHEKKFAQIAAKQTAPATNVDEISNAEQSLAKARTQTAPTSENELTAKLEPPVPAESRSAPRKEQARSDKDSGHAAPSRIPAQLMSKKLSAAGTASGQIGGATELRSAPQAQQSSEQVTVSGEAPEVATAPAPQAGLPLQARGSAAEVASTDSVAAAAPPTAQLQNKPAGPAATAKAAPAAGLGSVGVFSRQKTDLKTAQAMAIREEEVARVSSNYIPARWTISSDGTTLLRSTDQGRSWDAVNVASNVVLRAVAALGPEVWAGGKAGDLYHSSDLGMHWTQVKPTANGTALTADIVSLDFPDPEHGKLTTSEGKVWTTSDGGKTWQ